MRTMTQRDASEGALGDLVVIEIGDGVAAAYAAKMLADLGAETIKVEPPGGCATRRRGPFPQGRTDPEASGLFAYLNTNKLGVRVNLDTEEGRERLEGLLATADIVVTDLPGAKLEAARCAPSDLRLRHPRLIVATISPFGGTGPWSARLGDELTAFAASGLAYGTPGIPDAAEDLVDEPPLHPSCFAAETLAGIAAAIAIMAAVTARARSGEGCHIDLGAQAVGAAIQVRDLMPSSYGGKPYNRLPNPVSIGRMPNFYLPCSDGWVTVAAPMQVHWLRLVEAMGAPDWALSEAYATEKARFANWRDLRQALSHWTLLCSSDELHALGELHKIMIFPHFPISRTVGSDHVTSRESLVPVRIGGHDAQMPGAPFKMSTTPWALRRPAPALGEHDAAVFNRSKVTQ